jgi:hypothetical protein
MAALTPDFQRVFGPKRTSDALLRAKLARACDQLAALLRDKGKPSALIIRKRSPCG